MEIIILAIATFFIIKKLHSILGEEHDKAYFNYENQNFKDLKEAEKVNESDEIEENFNYLTNEAQVYAKEICKKIDNFSLNTFQNIAIKVMEFVIKANNNQDKETINKFLSEELAEMVCNSFNNAEKNNIILVSLKEAKLCDILKNGATYEIVVLFDMEQINYTTDKDNNIINGNKSEIVNVKERWYFSHNINSKNQTWFVNKIEEI